MELFYGTKDELEPEGIPVKTKDQLLKLCSSVSDYAVNYVNEPSLGLWFIQNHLHEKVFPRNAQAKSDLLLSLQESREVLLDLEGSAHFFPSETSSPSEQTLDETIALARALEENVKKFAEEHAEKLVVNKTLDVMLKESPEKAPSLVKKLSAVMGNGVDTVTPAADDFDNWYKSQFKE